jgi:hypothetical protein
VSCVRCGASRRLEDAINEAWRFRANADREAETLRALCVACAQRPEAPPAFDHRFCASCGGLHENDDFVYLLWDEDGRNQWCGTCTTWGCF